MGDTRRLLLLTTSLDRGGAQRQVVDIAARLRGRGWAVVVVSMTPPRGYVDELRQAGVPVASLRMRPGRPTPLGWMRYGAVVRRWRPDVVHAHMIHANLLARVGRPFAPRTPVVCTIHNVVEGARWRELAYRVTDPLATVTTAVSHAAAERYIRVGAVPRERVVVVHNGFEVRSQPTPIEVTSVRRDLAPDTGFVWLSVGRLDHQKGYDILIGAFPRLLEVVPDARLVIAGDGPERTALQDSIENLGLTGRVTLLGDRSDVVTLLAAADGFVLPSRWEGLPMVLLEAAAQRVPIVATDVGGSREVADPSTGAILTDVGADAIIGGMRRMMGLTAPERTLIGERLRDHARTAFDMAAIVDRWEAIYAHALGRGSERASDAIAGRP